MSDSAKEGEERGVRERLTLEVSTTSKTTLFRYSGYLTSESGKKVSASQAFESVMRDVAKKLPALKGEEK